MSAEEHTGLIAWFARNRVAANLLMFGFILLGILSAITIKKEFFPEFSLNIITIQVPYLGAAPEEVEEGVCIKVEEAIQDLDGIKKITSKAREGIGLVTVEVETGYDVLNLLDKVKVRVDAISTFPEETENPVIFEQTTKNQVLWMQVYGEVDERSLKEFAKKTREDLLAIPGITQVEIRGAREYEIAIEVSEAVLRQYGLTFDEVVQAVRQSSLDLPAGSIKTAGGEILLRTKGQAYWGRDFESIVLLTREDGTRLLLGDIANVVDGFEETSHEVRFNRLPSVSLQVFRVGDQSALDVAKKVREYVEKQQDKLPANIHLSAWADGSRLLKGRLNLMLKNAVLGGTLVFLSLTLFLRLRVAFWVMMGLPVCFLGTLWLMSMPFLDISINMITLFGFILVLGIVVDDAIVIGENIFTTIRRDGHTVENVIQGAREVALPATFGVLTTVAAFIPMLMIPGPNGKIWGGIGMVVILCLLFSLVESKLILPAHLAHMKTFARGREGLSGFARFQRRFADGLMHFVNNRYKPLLETALHNRYTTLAIFLSLLALTYGVKEGGLVRFVFFPDVETDFPTMQLEMVEGTPAAVTKAAANRIEQAIMDVDREYLEEEDESVVNHVLTLIESDSSAMFIVELTPSEDRDVGASEIVNRWRERVGEIPGAIDQDFEAKIANVGNPVNFQLNGDSFDELDAAAGELRDKLAEYTGVFDIKDSFSNGKQEIRLSIKPAAEALGLTLSDLARQVRQGFYGAEAQRIQRGKDEVKVMVRYPQSQRRSLGDLENMRIRTPAGDEVPFASVAEAQLGVGYPTITRIDRKRVVNVTADVDKNLIEPQVINKEIREEFMPGLLARYPGVNFSLEGESREQKESMISLAQGGGFALFVIFALMAVPLKSYVKPLIIMSVIPFGIVGAVIGHLIMGLPLSILSLCGIIALAGVVVNDGLVMVDFINKHEAEFSNKLDAVRQAGVRRFRPILLTSLTTFSGLLPMLMERSLQAKFLIPMAVSLAFGILFATVITLLLIPALYLILDDLHGLFSRKTPPSYTGSTHDTRESDLEETLTPGLK